MKLMKFINTRLLVVLGAVLACGLMCGPEVRGTLPSSTGTELFISNNTGGTLWVSVCRSSSLCSATSTYNTIFSLSPGVQNYKYSVPNTVYFQVGQTYDATNTNNHNPVYTYVVPYDPSVSISVTADSSGNITVNRTA